MVVESTFWTLPPFIMSLNTICSIRCGQNFIYSEYLGVLQRTHSAIDIDDNLNLNSKSHPKRLKSKL